MRWKISSLDDPLRQQLLTVCKDRGLSGEPCSFLLKRTLRILLVCLVLGAAATAVGLLLAVQFFLDQTPLAVRGLAVGLTGLAALWSLLLLVEVVRVAGSRLKPFILITPRVLLEAGGDHDYLTGYRLRDATDFQTVDNYSGVNFRGRRFTFQFADGSWAVTLKDAEAIRRVEQILAQARGGGAPASGGVHLLPEAPGLAGRSVRSFSNPLGEGWMGIGGVLLLCLMFGFVGNVVYSTFVGRH